jgi:hypothetical protein
MKTVSELQARVAASYAQLHLPAWPDAHPGMTMPGDEEFSRLTDPGRYRIVHARARVWSTVLEHGLGAQPEILAPAPPSDDGPMCLIAGCVSSPSSLKPCPCSCSSVTRQGQVTRR